MTIAGYIGCAVVVGLVALLGFSLTLVIESTIGKIVSGAITTAICIGVVFGFLFYYNNTAGGRRAFKSQESNLNNGIERTVTVYDVEGEVIKEYDGKFDITYDDDRILFDDENGKRHVIYYPTGTVTIDEK